MISLRFSVSNIKRIKKYDLPSDEELMRQALETVLCDTCYLNETCNRQNCFLNSRKKKAKKKSPSIKKDKQ